MRVNSFFIVYLEDCLPIRVINNKNYYFLSFKERKNVSLRENKIIIGQEVYIILSLYNDLRKCYTIWHCFLWWESWSLEWNAFIHPWPGHLYGVSPVWVFMCIFNLVFVMNLLPHTSHGNWLSMSWVFRWYSRESFDLNTLSHLLQG